MRRAIDGWFLADIDMRDRWEIRHHGKFVEHVEGGERDDAYERMTDLRYVTLLAALAPKPNEKKS